MPLKNMPLNKSKYKSPNLYISAQSLSSLGKKNSENGFEAASPGYPPLKTG